MRCRPSCISCWHPPPNGFHENAAKRFVFSAYQEQAVPRRERRQAYGILNRPSALDAALDGVCRDLAARIFRPLLASFQFAKSEMARVVSLVPRLLGAS